MPETSFDFDGFRSAYEAGEAAAWLSFYAEDAEWIAYWDDPPTLSRRATGRVAIGEVLTEAGAWSHRLDLQEPETDVDRIRFRARVVLPEGRRLVEHVMLTIDGDRIRRHVEVAALDS